MLKENAIVVDYQAGVATLQCQAKTACGQCAARSGCGIASLNQLNGEKEHIVFKVETAIPLQRGQFVEVGLTENSFIKSTLLLYIVPLLTLLASTLIADQWLQIELISAIFIFFCTALSFILIHQYCKKTKKTSNYQPVILRIL